MKTEFEIPDDALSDELKALFAQYQPLTPEEEEELAEANRKIQADPQFQADLQKALVVDHMLEGMERKGLNKKRLAERWGKSRQYVGRILNEDERVNFTLETMCEMLSLVGKRMRMVIEDAEGQAAGMNNVRSRELQVSRVRLGTLEASDTTCMEFWRQPPRDLAKPPRFSTPTLAPHDGEQDPSTATA
jgi:hypothetical protein